jgi:regulator of protease activity HflC (stomatin/prohibitin superfamily)
LKLSKLLQAAFLVLAFFWLTQNIRPIPTGSQAIVSRFGAIVRVQQQGLLVAWPPPLERVVILPVGERQLLRNEPGDARQLQDVATVLTDDGNLVRLDAHFAWSGAGDAQVAPALSAIFQASAVDVAAQRRLGDFLPAGGRQGAAAREILDAVGANLAALDKAGAGLGIRMTRAEVAASLPPEVNGPVAAAAAQARAAEAALVAARGQAAHLLQQTDQDRARLFANAHAEAAERIASARSSTATLTALEARLNQGSRPALLADLYRERIAAILRQAGSVSTVDPKSVSKVVIPDGGP